jgi:hypothetical protein
MLLQCLLWGRWLSSGVTAKNNIEWDNRKGGIGQGYHREPCARHRVQGQSELDVDAHRELSTESKLYRFGQIVQADYRCENSSICIEFWPQKAVHLALQWPGAEGRVSTLASAVPATNLSFRDEDDGFSRALVNRLIQTLENDPLPHLTPNEQAHLLVLIQTTLEVTFCLFKKVAPITHTL